METDISIDRLGPARRPSEPVVMYQTWSRLLFLHWALPPDQVRPLLPKGLDLDTFEGRAWVGLVPFLVSGARPVFVPPVPGISNFPEVNVRTYVHLGGREPGVCFFSLDAASRVAVSAARALYKLAYHHAEMSARVEGEHVQFRSRRTSPGPLPATCAVDYAARGEVRHAVPDTLEHFLVERYVLYAEDEGRLHRARVHHEAYPLREATVDRLEESLLAAAGIERPDTPPLAHYATEVHVEVFPLRGVD